MSKNFALTFNMDNDAFKDDAASETARILIEISKKAYDGFVNGKIYDVNGNSIGEWEIITVKDAPVKKKYILKVSNDIDSLFVNELEIDEMELASRCIDACGGPWAQENIMDAMALQQKLLVEGTAIIDKMKWVLRVNE